MLKDKLTSRSAVIGIIGLGYVGLPLAILSAGKGFMVRCFDKDAKRVESLKLGRSYLSHIPAKDFRPFVKKKRMQIHSDFEALKLCDVIVVCVPTPLDKANKPDYRHLFEASAAISANLRKEQLIVVESTVAPGVTGEKILPELAAEGLKAGSDFYLAYSPERVDPGNESFTVANIPKLVAGATPECLSCARALYENLGLPTVPVRNLKTAEMAKLLENTYRDVNIALVNEMCRICHENGIDIWEVIAAAATKPFGFQQFFPGPGVGGHCIPVDSVYYTSWAQSRGLPAEFAEKARELNSAMPGYVVDRLSELLRKNQKELTSGNLLVLGVTYKKNINDIRQSAALQLIEILVLMGASVSFNDPFIEEITIPGGKLKSIRLEDVKFSNYDCVVLAVSHSTYNLPWVSSVSPLLFDLTGEAPSEKVRAGHLHRL